MSIEDVKEMLNNSDYERNMLIIKKKFYDEHKKEIDEIIKNDYTTTITITNMLENKTDVRLVDGRKFLGKM